MRMPTLDGLPPCGSCGCPVVPVSLGEPGHSWFDNLGELGSVCATFLNDDPIEMCPCVGYELPDPEDSAMTKPTDVRGTRHAWLRRVKKHHEQVGQRAAVEGLRPWLEHAILCDWHKTRVMKSKLPCTCGLTAEIDRLMGGE